MKQVKSVNITRYWLLVLWFSTSCHYSSGEGEVRLNLTVSCAGESRFFCTLFNLTASYADKLVIEDSIQADLTELALRSSQLRRVPRDIFLQTPKLQTFITHNCGINNLDSLDFRNATNLRRLILQGNNFFDLGENIFAFLHFLEELHMAQNTLQLVHHLAFTNLTNLRYLDLQQNSLRWFPESALKELPNLEHIDLSYNEINIINEKTFAANLKLHTILLAHNQFKVFQPQSLQHLPQLRLLDVSSSAVEELYLKSVDMLVASECGLKTLRIEQEAIKVFAGNNRLRLGNFSVGLELSVQEVDLHGNQFEALDDLVGMLNLQRLDISNNRLTTLSTSADPLFLNLPSLVELNLSTNLLTDLNPNSFLLLLKLRVLDLAFNRLQHLESLVLEPLLNLEKLYIEGNHMFSLDFEKLVLTHTKLQELGLYENDFELRFMHKMIDYLRKQDLQLPRRFPARNPQAAFTPTPPGVMMSDVEALEHTRTSLNFSGIHPYWTMRDALTVITLCFVLLILMLLLYRLIQEEECCMRWMASLRARREGRSPMRDPIRRLSQDDSEV